MTWRRRDAGACRRAVGTLAVVVVAIVFGVGGSVHAQSAGGGACANYASFRALAAAAGVRTLQSWPGITLMDVDGQLPGSQALVGSTDGSSAWAGAPYSTAVGAVNQGGVDPGQVPVFAISSYPSNPEASTSSPLMAIEAKSEALASSAKAESGLAPSDEAASGRIRTASQASCGGDGTLEATAESVVDAFEVKDVLRIGSVRSTAVAVADPSGKVTLQGSIEVVGATVLGQPVSITDQGLVVAGSPAPLPDNPLVEALADAGIEIRYIAAEEDDERGVMAPGLELTVRRAVEGAGTAPLSSTYTLGRAHAFAGSMAGDALPTDDGGDVAPSVASGGSPSTPSAAEPSASAVESLPARDPVVLRPVQPRVVDAALAARFSDVSWRGAYNVVTIGVLLFVAATVMFKRLGVVLRWR